MRLPRGVKHLTTPRQVAAVSSPQRIEILEHLLLVGSSSAADLAALMGRPATGIHYHLKVLHGAGIVHVSGHRRAGKRDEALYQLVASAYAVGGKAGDRSARAGALRTIGATLRLAQREAGRALRGGQVLERASRRVFHSRRLRAPLTPAALARVNRLLHEIEGVFTAAVKRHIGRPRTPRGDVVSLTFVLTPAGRRREEVIS